MQIEFSFVIDIPLVLELPLDELDERGEVCRPHQTCLKYVLRWLDVLGRSVETFLGDAGHLHLSYVNRQEKQRVEVKDALLLRLDERVELAYVVGRMTVLAVR